MCPHNCLRELMRSSNDHDAAGSPRAPWKARQRCRARSAEGSPDVTMEVEISRHCQTGRPLQWRREPNERPVAAAACARGDNEDARDARVTACVSRFTTQPHRAAAADARAVPADPEWRLVAVELATQHVVGFRL